jgi:23S rRNA (guanine745-N1)-methyltransferase
MNILKAQNLACPIDGEILSPSGKQLCCANGHSYDIARQGYVNLLPVQHKRSKQPGDSKAMVLARNQFLNTGIYAPVAKKLVDIVIAQISDGYDQCLLDAGCGEGYYLDTLFHFLRGSGANANLSFIGMDISKDAIIQSSKRNIPVSWIVGTNRQPPVKEESVDIILCLFGFLSFDGFNKILKSGGKLILLDPGPDHLKELREILYPEVKKVDLADLPGADKTWFSPVASEKLRFEAGITGKEIINQLLVMTPHYYRASKGGRESATDLTELQITVDVIFRVLEKV